MIATFEGSDDDKAASDSADENACKQASAEKYGLYPTTTK